MNKKKTTKKTKAKKDPFDRLLQCNKCAEWVIGKQIAVCDDTSAVCMNCFKENVRRVHEKFADHLDAATTPPLHCQMCMKWKPREEIKVCEEGGDIICRSCYMPAHCYRIVLSFNDGDDFEVTIFTDDLEIAMERASSLAKSNRAASVAVIKTIDLN